MLTAVNSTWPMSSIRNSDTRAREAATAVEPAGIGPQEGPSRIAAGFAPVLAAVAARAKAAGGDEADDGFGIAVAADADDEADARCEILLEDRDDGGRHGIGDGGHA